MPSRFTNDIDDPERRFTILPPLVPKVAPFPARASVETASRGCSTSDHLEGDVTTLPLLGEEVHLHLSLVGDPAPIGGEIMHPLGATPR